MTQKRRSSGEVRPAYAKVGEYQQARPGAPARARAAGPGDARVPRATRSARRPRAFTRELLEQAVRAAVGDGPRRVARRSSARRACAGARSSTCARCATRRPAREIAGYLAKYATKSTEQAGGLLHRVDADEVEPRAGARARHAATCAPRSSSTPSRGRRTAARRRRPRPAPAPDVETDWHPVRARASAPSRAIASDETRAHPPARRHRARRPHHRAARRRAERDGHRRSQSSSTPASASTSPTSRSIAPRHARAPARPPRPAARRVRARVRLPRPLPDQEPPLLAPPSSSCARTARPACTSRSSPARTTPRNARSPSAERADRGARSRRRRACNSFATRTRALAAAERASAPSGREEHATATSGERSEAMGQHGRYERERDSHDGRGCARASRGRRWRR